MKINEITLSENATGGATSTGAIATTPLGKGKKKKNVGTLFGGSYKQVTEGKDNESSVIVAEIIKLISDGHTEVAPDVITAKVSAAVGRPFMLKDLVAANNNSPELQHYIDSINPSKIKFSTDILTVKNEDPVKEKEQSQAAVSAMASRAAGRDRLGESKSIAEVLNELEQGPGPNDPRRQQKGPIPQVKHGAVRSDPAKIDYATHTQGMVEPIRQAKKAQAAQRKAEKARTQRASERTSKSAMLASIAHKIESVVGQVVPDGDPIDYLAPYLNRMGIDQWDTTKYLDAAVKKHLGYKNYYDYLAAMWDMYNEVSADGEQRENPWR